ncbi:hypothetical protein E2P81_ATG00894 [Venturia nashicola]|uniref:Uncharacterized protein n=1 Tax=Venturia nashicola TaxID=86259 RepID=A0A4Z1PCA2_9PEZI|nr:hypothetical protein E6O75_ATG00913 [Venturia nashicola]TLD38351.1 hypothetical protein E2P81_ATG00894 [Venturia nashicola]
MSIVSFEQELLHLVWFHGPQVQTTDNRTLFSQEMFERMPDCAPTFEQREFLSWYQLNAYFCPEREAPVSPYVNNESAQETTPPQVVDIPIQTTSIDKTACKVPKLRTSRNRIRIQDLRSVSVAVSSRTSSPDADVQQRILEDFKDVHSDSEYPGAQVRLQEYQYAEKLAAIPEEDDEEDEKSVTPSCTTQNRDYLEVKPLSQLSDTPSEDFVSSLDATTFRRRLNDMLHGSPNSQHSRTASSCTQVDDDDPISLIDELDDVDEEMYHQRLRRGPSFTESEVEEWYGEQPEHGPKSVIQSLSADLDSQQFNEDANMLFLAMEKCLDELGLKHSGSSELIEEAKWRLASIMKEIYRESTMAD